MRKLLTTNIGSTSAMPVKSGTLDHLQLANQELFDAIGRSIVGNVYDSTKVYIIYGCVNTGVSANYIISAGCVFYNGEFYQVDATSFTAAGGQIAVATIGITYNLTNADPVTFTDGATHSVHQIRKMAIASAASGSGIADFVNFIPVLEARRYVGTAGNPAFQNSWHNVASTENLNFRKSKGKVYISGVIANPSGPSIDTVCFTLPADYTPSVMKVIAISGGNAIIDTSGNVTLLLSSGTNIYVSDISFLLE